MKQFKVGDKVKCLDTIADKDKKVRFIKDKEYEVNALPDEHGRYGFLDENKKLTRWGSKFFELVGVPKQTGVTGLNTEARVNPRGTHKCTCDFYNVVLVKGCQCGGV